MILQVYNNSDIFSIQRTFMMYLSKQTQSEQKGVLR